MAHRLRATQAGARASRRGGSDSVRAQNIARVQQRRRGNGDNPNNTHTNLNTQTQTQNLGQTLGQVNSGLGQVQNPHDTIAIDVRSSYSSTSFSTSFNSEYTTENSGDAAL